MNSVVQEAIPTSRNHQKLNFLYCADYVTIEIVMQVYDGACKEMTESHPVGPKLLIS